MENVNIANFLNKEEVSLYHKGLNFQSYKILGSKFIKSGVLKGVTCFAVWAPNAKSVSVIGDFNNWNEGSHIMKKNPDSGIWVLFVENLKMGSRYKYYILSENNKVLIKTDPFSTYYSSAPDNSSIIHDINNYKWNDDKWMSRRSQINYGITPISIYELHLGSWAINKDINNSFLNYREISELLIPYVLDLGFTHVQLMPIAEYPYYESWGYQVTGYYAPTSRFGNPEDLKYLIDKLHRNNIGVILDWVPAHFPEDDFALSKFDGTALYEHLDPRQGKHPDWGTSIFNYGRNEVISFLTSSAAFWFDHYHIDGLRVDAVASMLYLDYSRKDGEWVPNKYGGKENLEAINFLKILNTEIHSRYSGALMIAEESTAFPNVTANTSDSGLGFDFKWNLGWMNDLLEYFSKDHFARKEFYDKLTFGMIYQYSEKFIQVFSHDEVVHEKKSMLMKMAGDTMEEKFKQLRLLYGLMWMWPGKKSLFMGNEFAQVNEWNHNATLDWKLLNNKLHLGVQSLIKKLNFLYLESEISAGDIDNDGFKWVCCSDENKNLISFIRKGALDSLLIVANFSNEDLSNLKLDFPLNGVFQNILNTNSIDFGGTSPSLNQNDINIDSKFDGTNYYANLDMPSNALIVYKFSSI